MIDTLYKHHEFIPAIVDAIWDEWSEDYIARTRYKTKKDLEALYFKAANNAEGIPEAYVIFEGDTVIGSCLIDVEDMGVHPVSYIIPGPWLANVYVMKPFRNKGYATRLLEYVVARYENMHLWTFNMKLATFYERFGFCIKEIISEKCIYMEKFGNNLRLI